jgi:hypothetical protein
MSKILSRPSDYSTRFLSRYGTLGLALTNTGAQLHDFFGLIGSKVLCFDCILFHAALMT